MSRRSRALLAGLAVLLVLPVYARVAPLEAPESRSVVPGTVVLDVHGSVLEHDAADGLRIPVSLDAVAPRMVQATVSAEDRRFWQHPGVDPFAIVRALSRIGTQPSGASTITQQLARRLYLSDDASSLPVRKAHEALIALQLEARRSKSEILDLYLNDVYYGRGAYGIEAASRLYFGISASNLDLAHAAYLAGLPQRPASYETADDASARARQSYVLARMVEDGWISRVEAEAASAEPIAVLPAQRSPA
ncbi:MAG TPA: transglycosylase domain-containing protein, partial [Candidatus Limnocylindria bacterium]|nr:transglycosylase domain-containing protein [Candidatus Limnocylindria bacterium]